MMTAGRAINNEWPAEPEIADAEMCEPRQAGGAWRGSWMTLGLKGKRERKHLVGRESARPYATSFPRAINNSCDPNLMKWISNFN
jgi:hypothetical protein